MRGRPDVALLILIALLTAACAGPPAAAILPTPAPAPPATRAPTAVPTASPTAAPTSVPTEVPTRVPTAAPTRAPTAEPTPAPVLAPPVRLVIADIRLDRELLPVGLDRNRYPVVPDHDVGWYTLGAMPGQGENVVLWGHVLRFRKAPQLPAPFARLKELEPGATVVLYDANGVEHRYTVTRQVWATPDQVEYMLPQGREQVTMISCIGDRVIEEGALEMTHRLITIAEPEA